MIVSNTYLLLYKNENMNIYKTTLNLRNGNKSNHYSNKLHISPKKKNGQSSCPFNIYILTFNVCEICFYDISCKLKTKK